jgi:hypothetical protein
MRLLPLAVAAGLTLTVTACGGEDEPVTAPPAAPSASATGPDEPASPSPAVPAQPSSAPAVEDVRLTGDGVDVPDAVVTFGTPYEQAVAALKSALGEPTKDTGPIDPSSGYGTCPGPTLQVLEYGGGALQLLFGRTGAADAPVLHTWALTDIGDPAAVPTASALVGDVTTYELGVGTTVGELRDGLDEQTFQITEDAVSMDPAFTVQDQSSGFRGFLTGRSASDRVTFVEAGAGCGP